MPGPTLGHEYGRTLPFTLIVTSKGVDLTGLLGDIKEDWGSGDGSLPAWSRGGASVGGLGDEAETFL